MSGACRWTLHIARCTMGVIESLSRMPRLKVVTPEQLPASFELDREEISIGRAPDCGIKLPHESVSWGHARISRGNGTWWDQPMAPLLTVR